jgi:hypothetical protein
MKLFRIGILAFVGLSISLAALFRRGTPANSSSPVSGPLEVFTPLE